MDTTKKDSTTFAVDKDGLMTIGSYPNSKARNYSSHKRAEFQKSRDELLEDYFERLENGIKPVDERLYLAIVKKRAEIRGLLIVEDHRKVFDLPTKEDKSKIEDSGLVHERPITFAENQLKKADDFDKATRELIKQERASGNFYPDIEEIFSPEIAAKKRDFFIQMIELTQFFGSTRDSALKGLLVYSSLAFPEGNYPIWDKLPKLYKHCLMTLSMRAQCKQLHSFTLNFGRELNKKIKTSPETLKKELDALTKRVQKNVRHQGYTNFRIWFALEYSEKDDIGFHLQGFVGWDEGSEEKLRSILRKTVGEWPERIRNKQIKLKPFCVFYKDAIKQTFYALKAPVYLYSSRDTTQNAKAHYEILRNAMIIPSAS